MPEAIARAGVVMWKKVASQGAVSAHRVPTTAAVNAVATATRRSERTSRVRAIRANESNTFCGPSNARNVTNVSARLRLAMIMMMACPDVRAKPGARNSTSPSVAAVYDRPRVTVVLALYDGSGWGRA